MERNKDCERGECHCMSYLFPTYTRMDVQPVSASGATIIDKNGKTYVDLTAGIGVCNLGHQPEIVKAAVQKQLDRYWHVSNLFASEEQEAAAKRLVDATGMGAVFFANSGAEANEAAIKLARKATGKTKIITFLKSFHGRTFATMAATGQEKIKEGYGAMLEEFVYLPFNDLEALKSEIGADVAAVMIEIVQGEGGVHISEPSFLKELEALCQQYGALLIIDEIQTGIGRTGRPFAYQHFDLYPQIVTVAKGLGSGFPIGAMLGEEKLITFFGPGSHGSTFGGNPLAISAATTTMDVIFTEEFLQAVREKGTFLLEELKRSLAGNELVTEVRGLGLMIGIELGAPIQNLLAKLRTEGILALPAGENVLRLLPPLTITLEELEGAIEKIVMAIAQYSNTIMSS